VDPADARVEVASLLGGPDPERRDGELALPPGIYRVRARAPDRVDTVATLVVPPEARARVEIRLPPLDASGPGWVHYAGLWIPSSWADRNASRTALVPAASLPPYRLAARPVTNAELGRFLRERGLPTRDRREPRDDDPAVGVPRETAEAYAAATGARLPTELELQHAALAALPKIADGAENGSPARKPWMAVAEAVGESEGVAHLGRYPSWARKPGGLVPWPSRALGLVGIPRNDEDLGSYVGRVGIRLARDGP
jgi:hypothetical protein